MTAIGKGAITTQGVTTAAGALTLNVRPGQYNITINENVTNNSNDSTSWGRGPFPSRS